MNDLLRKVLRRLTASTVLALQVVLGLATVLLGWLLGWQVAVVGVVLMNVLTMLAVLGPWGVQPQPRPAPGAKKVQGRVDHVAESVERLDERVATKGQLTQLEKRVDALGARMLASSERTRVELLDALAAERVGPGGTSE